MSESSPVTDALVVLGSGIRSDGSLPAGAKARVKRAAELYHSGAAPRIIVAGKWEANRPTPPPRTEAEAMASMALELGVWDDDVIEEATSHDTVSNALHVKRDYLVPNGWHSVTIVTSPYHVERTTYIFKKILGPNYGFNIEVADDDKPAEGLDKRMIRERAGLAAIRSRIDTCADGNDKAIAKAWAAD